MDTQIRMPTAILLFLLTQLLAAAAVYAAVRADLREALVRVDGHDQRINRLEQWRDRDWPDSLPRRPSGVAPDAVKKPLT